MMLLSTDTALLLSALKSIDPMQDSAAGRRPLEKFFKPSRQEVTELDSGSFCYDTHLQDAMVRSLDGHSAKVKYHSAFDGV
jgi:hypothetical protein